MNKTRYGTCYFPTLARATAYYRPYAKIEGIPVTKLVDRKLDAKEIFIGEPPLKPGETLTIEDNRYFVTEAP
jgi:hypothetical protein